MTRTNATLWIEGYCPMGCGRTLFLGEGGYVTCSFIPCPRPDAVADLLADSAGAAVIARLRSASARDALQHGQGAGAAIYDLLAMWEAAP